MDKTNNSEILKYVVVNGERMPAEQAKISLFNTAFLSSYGVYETVKVDQGRPFYLKEHLQRLLHSAEMIGLDLKVDVPTLAEWFNRLHQIDPQATWSLKLLALGPLDSDGLIVALQALPLPTYPASFYQEGAKAVLYEGKRTIPLCKSLNTLVNYMAGSAARQAGALEGLLHNDGYLTEGSRSSLFVVRAGRLLTCPQALVLPGITRDIVEHVMQDTATPVIEEMLPVDLSLYDEMFITATSMHVMPITQVGGKPLGNGRVGPVTRLAMEKFNTHYRNYMQQA